MALLDCTGNEGLNVNYNGGIDYSRVPGEAIFINSNLILTELAVSWRRTFYEGETEPEERPLKTGYWSCKERVDQSRNSLTSWETQSNTLWELEYKNCTILI